MTRSVDARSDAFVDEFAALDPIEATFAGVTGYDHLLPDLSPDGFDAREELHRRAVAEVRALTPVDAREAVARDAFLERVGLAVERADAQLERSDFSVISSGVHAVREVFDLMPTASAEDWEVIGERLSAVPQALAGYRTTLAAEADAGRVAARRQYVEVADQVRGWTGQQGAGGDFFANLVATAPADQAEALRAAAGTASAAVAEFGRFVSSDLVPRGRERDGVGREHYGLASRSFLGAQVDLEETYHWGWTELKRIEDDMAATARTIMPGGSLDDAVAALDADPARDCGSREAFEAWMQGRAEEILSSFHGVHFDIAEPIRTIACKVAPVNDGGAWYHPPSEDFSRPGTMWFSFTDERPPSRRGARPPRSSTRAFPATTCSARRPSTVPTCSTGGSACCAGSAVTARAGRCTPSG